MAARPVSLSFAVVGLVAVALSTCSTEPPVTGANTGVNTGGGTGGGTALQTGGGGGGGTGGGATGGGATGGGTGGSVSTGGGPGAVDAGAPDAGFVCTGHLIADGGCAPLTFAELCSLKDLVVLDDGVAVDRDAGVRIAQAIESVCAPPPAWRVDVAALGDVVSVAGAPLISKEQSIICGGGGWYQTHAEWLDAHGATKVVDSTNAGMVSFSRRDGTVIVSAPFSTFTGNFDFFLVQLARADTEQPISLLAYGPFSQGTAAAAWFFEHDLAPNFSSRPESWYLGRWSDTSGDGQVGAGDTFELVASGH